MGTVRGPFRVLNGAPGYINLLDAISAWQLVRELRAALGEPAGASFKHVSPAGAGIGLPLSDALRAAYQVGDRELSPVATAYVRARGGDLVSSYGDVAAVSDRVDVSLALVLKREVSDGIVAPAFDADALDILRAKKGGRYLIIEADPDFETPALERRSAFGLTLEAPADTAPITPALLGNVVTRERDFPPDAVRDLMVATIALRYTQSNSVCLAADGQVIGLGAGQQSRIHCSRIACGKADRWMLQQHPRVLALPFAPGIKRPERFHRPRAVHRLGGAVRARARPPPRALHRARRAPCRTPNAAPGLWASAPSSATTPSCPSATTSTARRPAPCATSCSPAAASPTPASPPPPTSTA